VNTTTSSSGNPFSGPTSLGEIFRLFLRLGMTAFGGPAAHLALMQFEAVERRKWMTRERFLDLVGACNLLPGPGSTQVAMALGYSRRRWAGLLVAGACFILPASFATLALAWLYVRFGTLAIAQGLLYGAKPVMLAILSQAVWKLGSSAWRTIPLAFLSVVCAVAALLGMHPLVILIAAGSLALLAKVRNHPAGPKGSLAAFASMFSPAGLPVAASTAGGVGLLPLLAVFLKLGVAVFGSGRPSALDYSAATARCGHRRPVDPRPSLRHCDLPRLSAAWMERRGYSDCSYLPALIRHGRAGRCFGRAHSCFQPGRRLSGRSKRRGCGTDGLCRSPSRPRLTHRRLDLGAGGCIRPIADPLQDQCNLADPSFSRPWAPLARPRLKCPTCFERMIQAKGLSRVPQSPKRYAPIAAPIGSSLKMCRPGASPPAPAATRSGIKCSSRG